MKNYITKAGAERLRAEYQQLLREERPKIVETVAWAAGNGDRSENGDYIYGKRRLREIDRRLRVLGQKLESAEVVDVSQVRSEKIVFGAVVTVVDEDENLKTVQLVGEDEIDVKQNQISWRSPLGRALLGKTIEDEVEVKTPAGEKLYWIKVITYPKS